MRYIDVKWIHKNAHDPIRLVSELDHEGYEVRKLEFFTNGTVGVAGASIVTNDTRLGEAPVPDLEEINTDPQFYGVAMEQREFEELWRRYARNGA
jgi:hypothetical protein